MSKKVSIPVSISWKDRSISRLNGMPILFPHKCVYCGGPKETTINLRQSVRTQKKGKHIVYICKPPIPYCRKHAQQSTFNSGILIILYVVFLVVGLVSLIGLSNRLGPLQNFFYEVLIRLGLAFGTALIGFLATVIIKLALSSIFKSMADLPLLVSFWYSLPVAFNFTSGALGFSFNVMKHNATNQTETYTFDTTYTNEEYATEFQRSNPSQAREATPNNFRCPTCNAKFEEGDMFCTKCGTRV